MKYPMITLFVSLIVPMCVIAANPSNPKPVEVQGTVDVNVVSPAPLPVEVSGGLAVDTLPGVELAPGQQVGVREHVYDPADLLILQSFIATNTATTKLVTIPKTMVLRTITVVPSSIDTDPNLYNCGATVRWPNASNPTDPASTDRIIAHHKWEGANHRAFNYPMPYNVRLVQGSQLETSVGRVGGSGFCEALIVLTGTKISS